MKKIFFFLSAIALLGLTAACVEQQPVNPNYDAATNSVKTAFTFNIAATSPQTKSNATTAQNVVTNGVNNFRGMTNMTLFALQGNVDFDNAKAQRYDLGTLGSGVIGNSDDKPSHKIYPLSIPVGTDNMVFYAKATKTGTNAAAHAEYGITNFPTAWTTKNAVEFTLSPRLTATTYTTTAQAIAAALNDILKAQFIPTAPDGQTASAITWKQLVTAQDMNQKYATFKAVYDAIVPIRDGEVRSGSAPAVLRTASDIYKAMNVILVNTPEDNTNPDVTDVRALATAIINAIKAHFTTTSSDVTAWSESDNVNAAFPTNLNLPAGAAQLSYTANNGFAPVTDPVLDPANVTGSAVAVANFMYPAELCYWSASKINVTDVDKTDTDYPLTTTDWDGNWTTDWTINGTVKASTKAVAMKNNIHYGTALLATTVKYDSTIPTKTETVDGTSVTKLQLKDSNNEDILVADDGLQLTGILVGKQSSSMGWNFISKDKSFDKIVYDNAIVDGDLKIDGDPTEANYTLLFDNYEEAATTTGDDPTQGEATGTATSSNVVLVALEFKNNTGKDFMGLNNLIPKNGTFYLVGKLDLSKKAADAETWPKDDYKLPGDNTPRVFIQDYMTTANFTIKEESLKKAYYTVPDLRSTQMTFGLSVDLKWRSGYTFNVDFE